MWEQARCYFYCTSTTDLILQLWADQDTGSKKKILGGASLRITANDDWLHHSVRKHVELPFFMSRATAASSEQPKPDGSIVVSAQFFAAADECPKDERLKQWAPLQAAGCKGDKKTTGPLPASSKLTNVLQHYEVLRVVAAGDLPRLKLLSHSFDIDPGFRSPELASGFSPFLIAVALGHLHICKFFARYVGSRHPERFRQLFKEKDMFARDTAVDVGAAFGQLDVVKWMLSHGYASVFEANYDGNTPLHLAALNGHLELFVFLLEQMRCEDAKLSKAFSKLKNKLGTTPFLLAARGGHVHLVRYMVEELGCDPNKQRAANGNTALHQAAYYGHLHLIEYLSNQPGFDANVVNVRGNAPLHLAWRHRMWHSGRLLLKVGADPLLENKELKPLNIEDRLRMTCLDEVVLNRDSVRSFFVDFSHMSQELEALRLENELLRTRIESQASVAAAAARRRRQSRKHSSQPKSSFLDRHASDLDEYAMNSIDLTAHRSTIASWEPMKLPLLKQHVELLRQKSLKFSDLSPMFQSVQQQVAEALESQLARALQALHTIAELLPVLENVTYYFTRSPHLLSCRNFRPLVERLFDIGEPAHWPVRLQLAYVLSEPRLGQQFVWDRLCTLMNAYFAPLPTAEQQALRSTPGLQASMFRSPLGTEICYVRAYTDSTIAHQFIDGSLVQLADVDSFDCQLFAPHRATSAVVQTTGEHCFAVRLSEQPSPLLLCTLTMVQHQGILRCIGCTCINDRHYVLLSCNGTARTLADILNPVTRTFDFRLFPLRARLRFASDLLDALVFANERGFCMRSLSSRQVIVTFAASFDPLKPSYHDCTMSLNPLALVHAGSSLGHENVDPWWLAPERIARCYGSAHIDDYSSQADLYSFGLLLWSLLYSLDAGSVIAQTSIRDFPNSSGAFPDFSSSTFRNWYMSRATCPLSIAKTSRHGRQLAREAEDPRTGIDRDMLLDLAQVLLRCWADSKIRIVAESVRWGLRRISSPSSLRFLCIQCLISNKLPVTHIPEELLQRYYSFSLWL